MWSTSVGGHLMKVVNLTGFAVLIYVYSSNVINNIKKDIQSGPKLGVL